MTENSTDAFSSDILIQALLDRHPYVEVAYLLANKEYDFKRFPLLELSYKHPISKDFGEKFEKIVIEDYFSDLIKSAGTSEFDATISGTFLRTEVKTARPLMKDERKSLIDRMPNYDYFDKNGWKDIGVPAFQQIKPGSFDYLVGAIVFKDRVVITITPSYRISKRSGKTNNEEGKIPLNKQHRNSDEEGQASIKYFMPDRISTINPLGIQKNSIKAVIKERLGTIL
jgi:hypothetical protein